MLQLTFNPGLTLTGFRTTRPGFSNRTHLDQQRSTIILQSDTRFPGDETEMMIIPQEYNLLACFREVFTTAKHL